MNHFTISMRSFNCSGFISVSIGNGSGSGVAWGCDISYDYVRINAELTT